MPLNPSECRRRTSGELGRDPDEPLSIREIMPEFFELCDTVKAYLSGDPKPMRRIIEERVGDTIDPVLESAIDEVLAHGMKVAIPYLTDILKYHWRRLAEDQEEWFALRVF